METSKNIINDIKKNEHKLEKMGERAIKSSRETVAKNPFKGIAIAAFTGALIGSLITYQISHRE